LFDTDLGEFGPLLELERAEISERRVTPRCVIEGLDVIEHGCPCLVPRSVGRAVRSDFGEKTKLSIAASCQTLPDRPIEHTMPCPAISRWNGPVVEGLPWTPFMCVKRRCASG
jgi:hypothetical protein